MWSLKNFFFPKKNVSKRSRPKIERLFGVYYCKYYGFTDDQVRELLIQKGFYIGHNFGDGLISCQGVYDEVDWALYSKKMATQIQLIIILAWKTRHSEYLLSRLPLDLLKVICRTCFRYVDLGEVETVSIC